MQSNLAPCSLYPEPASLIEECGDCGGHTIINAIDYVGNIRQEGRRKCANCGSRKIIKVPAGHQAAPKGPDPLPPAASIIAATEPCMEEPMKKEEKRNCRIEGCTKYGSFDGMCTVHFKEVHGISYPDFLRRRKAGETEEEILGNPQKTVNRQSSIVNGETKPANKKEFNTGDLVAVKNSKPPKHGTKSMSTISDLKKAFKGYKEGEKTSAIVSACESLVRDLKSRSEIHIVSDMPLFVDFTDHADLFEKLTTMANDQLRTPALQLLAMIRDAEV